MATIDPITGQLQQVTDPNAEINQAYQTLFGRAADPMGAQYWAGTGLTGQDLFNAMGAGAQGADIQAYQAYAQKAPAAGRGVGIATLQQPEKIAEAQAATPTPMTIGTPDTVTNYGNVKFTPVKQGLASDFAEKYLGTSELTPDQLNFIAQNYTGANLENTVKLLAEQTQVTNLYQSTLGRNPTPEELAEATKKYNWKNIGEGITSNLGSQVITGDPTIDYVINQAYETLGRTGIGEGENQIDQAGFDYWKGQLANGNITLNQFKEMFGAAAEEDLIESGYRTMFGRDPTTEDLSYWTNSLNTTSQDEIYKALQSGATGTDLLALTNYLASQGQSTDEFIKKYLDAEDDILNEYEAFMEYNIDPTRAGTITGSGTRDTAAIPYFNEQTVTDAYKNFTTGALDDVFGDGSADYFLENSPEAVTNYINQLYSGKITRDQFIDLMSNSNVNRNQEATRISGLYKSIYGLTDEQVQSLKSSLLSGEASGIDQNIFDDAKKYFETGIEEDSGVNDDFLYDAANSENASNLQYFIDNPNIYNYYRDISDDEAVTYKMAGSGGQYGYINGIPILKASEVDQMFNQFGTNTIMGNAPDRLDNDIGWDTGSLSGAWIKGSDVLGTKKIATVDEYGNTTYSYEGLDSVAKMVGIDPNDFQDTYSEVEVFDPETGEKTKKKVINKTAEEQLYEAINNATYKGINVSDLLYVAGKTGGGSSGAGKTTNGETKAFTDDAKVSGNHGKVLYIRDEKTGKYVPVPETLGFFNAGTELSPGSWFTDIASLPFVAELALLSGQAWAYPLAKGAQTAILGGDIGDVAKSAGTAALATYGPKLIAPEIAGSLEGIEGLSPETVKFLTSTGTNAALSSGIAALQGNSIGDALTQSLAGSALVGGINTLLPEINESVKSTFNLSDADAKIFTNTLIKLFPTILQGGNVDLSKVIMNYLITRGIQGAKKGTA